MSKSKRSLQLSITEFAVPSPRFGSIESESGYGALPMVGTDIHQEIQAQRLREGGAYVAEKWIAHSFESGGYKITVSGRMDGMSYGPPLVIEEIKSSYAPEALFERLSHSPLHPYVLQLRTYGYLHFLSTNAVPELVLLVVCARTRKVMPLHVPLDLSGYELWLKARVQEIAAEEDAFVKLREKRRKAGQTMAFPFDNPRPGQKELIEKIREKMGNKTRALLQAPTGLGKTVGVLYPSLEESLSRGQKTIYVTAKNSQHGVAEDAVERLQATGAKIKSITVHAKSKMCLKDEVFCSPSHCEYAEDYYSKLHNHDVVNKVLKKKRLTERTFKKIGQEYKVCPFELQLECVPKTDVVVCDYNYVFSPRNILGRIQHNGYSTSTPPNLVIDEAHNLAPRANAYYSAELYLFELNRLMEEATYLPEPLWDKCKSLYKSCESVMTTLAGENTAPAKLDVSELDLSFLEGQAQDLLRGYLDSDLGLRPNDPVLKLCNVISEFSAASLNSGEEFLFTITPSGIHSKLRITCCDASKHLSERYEEFANVVAFSATVKPFDFHLKTLGMDPETTLTEEFHSPFPRENRKILIIPQISTKMRDRNSNYGKIRDIVEKVARLKPGNYFVFFPSFDFLTKVHALVNLPEFRILRQEREMRRKQIEEYVDALRDPETPTIIFAVQGGVFSEGVDYPGDMLIGAMIVGPALPAFDFERECLREYFDSKGGEGFDYAYTFPAMTRVVQSAGRVIRSSADRGLIVLMDRRFLSANYIKAMPGDWLADGTENLQSKQILADVQKFWEDDAP